MNTIKKINAKHLLLLFIISVPFALFMNLQNANVVTIHADYPTHIIAGTSFPITVTIDKGNLSGFGRYTHKLPEGFVAESDMQNFEFSENTVKFLWVNIPYANSFTFTYNVFVPVDYTGDFTVAGKFGYVVDNEKRFAELAPNNISVVNDPLALRKYQAEQAAKTAPVNINDITCYRTVNITNNEAVVSIRVNKANVNTMCKIEEMLPEGYVFYAIERENADFSSHRNIARFMWINAPQKDIFYVSYKVIANPGYSIKNLYINGAFTFLDNGTTQSVVILEKDLRAISESNGKGELETRLNPDYNPNMSSGISSSDNVNASPNTTNYSNRAQYDINSKNINSDLNNNQASLQNKSQASSNTVNTTPKSVSNTYEKPEEDPEALTSNLKSKNYNQKQVDFFTTTNVNSNNQPKSTQMEYGNTGDVTKNLNQKTSTIPNSNTKTTVNINAIPAPSTYFPTQTYNAEDPDNVSSTLNPSYNRNMESGGLLGSQESQVYVRPTEQQNTINNQPRSTNNVSSQNKTVSNQNTTAVTNKTTSPSNNTQKTSSQDINSFENTLNIPAPTVNQANSQVQKNNTIAEVAQTTPNITKYPDANNSSSKPITQNQQQNVTYSQSNPPQVTTQDYTTSSDYNIQQKNLQSQNTVATSPSTSTSRVVAQTNSNTPIQTGTQQTTKTQISVPTNQTGTNSTVRIPTQTVSSQPGVQNKTAATTVSVPTQTGNQNTVRIPTQTVTSSQPSSQNKTAATTVSVPTQTGTNSTVRIPTQTVTSSQPGVQNKTATTTVSGQNQTTNNQNSISPANQTTSNTVRIPNQSVTSSQPGTQNKTATTTVSVPTQTGSNSTVRIPNQTVTSSQPAVQNKTASTSVSVPSQTNTNNGAVQSSNQNTVLPSNQTASTAVRIPTQTVTTSQSGVQNKTAATTVYVPTQSNGTTTNNVASAQTNQATLQNKTQSENVNYLEMPATTTQTIIRDENHNKLSVDNSPRLSNKDDISQNETKITQITEPNGIQNVYFRVQISAGHKLVNTKYYFNKLKIRDNVIVEQIAGWYKYTIQKFESYVSAKNQRNSIWEDSPLRDAFVVAYNGRKRITVQEALMITNQKWVE